MTDMRIPMNVPARSAASARFTLRRASALLVLAGLVAGGALALADDPKSGQISGSLDQPLWSAKKPRGSSSSSTSNVTMMFSQTVNGQEYTVKIENGETTATENGKKIPSARLRETGDTIEILDETKDVVATFQKPQIGGDAFGWGDQNLNERMHKQLQELLKLQNVPGQARPFWRGDQLVPGVAIAGDNPPVMLGVGMSSSDKGGVTLDNVVPGLPADKAGLKAGDRVTRIDGHAVDSAQDVRDVLRDLKPGQKVDVKFVRDDDEKTANVELEAFAPEKLGSVGLKGPGSYALRTDRRDSKWFEDAGKAIDKAISDVRNSEKMERAKQQAIEALETAKKSLEEAKDRVASQWQLWMQDHAGQGKLFGDQGDVFVVPAPPAAVAPATPAPAATDAALGRTLERLSDKLDRLDRRLDELERRMRTKE